MNIIKKKKKYKNNKKKKKRFYIRIGQWNNHDIINI